MKTAIITDTNSGLTVEDGKRIGVYVLPMPVIVDGRGYLEGVDITHSELYEALRSDRDVCPKVHRSMRRITIPEFMLWIITAFPQRWRNLYIMRKHLRTGDILP